MESRRVIRTAVVLVLLAACGPVFATDLDLSWYTLDGGGGVSAGGAFELAATIGQPDAGRMSGGPFELVGGLWAAASLPTSPLPGDCDEDGDVDLDDFRNLSICIDGPGGAVGPGCDCFDSDVDADVDLVDFAGFMQAFTGG